MKYQTNVNERGSVPPAVPWEVALDAPLMTASWALHIKTVPIIYSLRESLIESVTFWIWTI